jgi:uracil-DNA glycosylase
MSKIVRRDAPVMPADAAIYNIDCRKCTRLATFLDVVREENPAYFCRPVPPFGDVAARLIIVGLAPGMHGANASGRPFTGDYAGILLYATLHKFGFATQPQSTHADDDLRLLDARITNAVKCLPPANKPMPVEIRTCNAYLAAELRGAPAGAAILALGRIAHEATLFALGLPQRQHGFAHGARHALANDIMLFDSYHCSRYNTNTRRLTTTMFEEVFVAVTRHLGSTRARAA